MPAAVKIRKKPTKPPVRFRQREIERAIRGMNRMGLQVNRVEIDPVTGKFAISTDATPATDATAKNPWDKDNKKDAGVVKVVKGLPQSLKGIVPESWDCVDCGVNTAPGFKNRVEVETAAIVLGDKWQTEGFKQTFDSNSEIYTVRTHVWAQAQMEPWGGCLCIGCLEERIGRKLRPQDFMRDDAFNNMPGTPRLLQRRGKTKVCQHE